MSAFIIGKETMDHVLTMIDREQQQCMSGEYSFGGHRAETTDDLTTLGQTFYAMNLDAVTQRYPGDTKEHAPGPCDISDIHENYVYQHCDMTPAQGYKSIRCLIYQCSEGNVPDVCGLYKTLAEFAEKLAHSIASDSPEYEAADWG